MYYDNSAAVSLSKNDMYSKWVNRHGFQVSYRERWSSGQRIFIEYISTQLIVSDPLTKALPPKTKLTELVLDMEMSNFYVSMLVQKLML